MTDRGIRSAVGRRRALVAGGSAAAGLVVGSQAARAADDYSTGHRPPSYRVSPPSPRSGAFEARVLWRTGGPGVALTFDDGPDPRWTPRILDILAAAGPARATFFVLRDHLRAHPQLVRRAAEAGHEIGVHGADHRDMAQLSPDRLARSMGETAAAVADLTGRRPVLMRPPYGRFDAPVLHAATMQQLRMVLWSDWLPGTDSLAATRRLQDQLRPGAIVLCHDGRGTPSEPMITALRGFVPFCQGSGLPLRTVSELIAAA